MEKTMPNYYYKTNSEMVKCVNCGFTEFKRRDLDSVAEMAAYECGRCHFTAWFPQEYAPSETGKEGK